MLVTPDRNQDQGSMGTLPGKLPPYNQKFTPLDSLSQTLVIPDLPIETKAISKYLFVISVLGKHFLHQS